MTVLRTWSLAALASLALIACGRIDSGAAPQVVLPTADVITPPAEIVRVVPLTFTPAPARIELSPAQPNPADRSFSTAMPTAEAAAMTLSAPTVLAATPAGDPAAALEAELIVEINKVRLANGLPPYRVSPELSAAARAHSCDLATHYVISHVSSDGRNLAERLAGGEQVWEWPSENIAAGVADPATIVAWWMDEPPDGWHRRNILDTQQREVGAGYCFAADDPSGNHWYWTADFSRRGAGP
jgi:uncharacterized protein YkwD